MIRGRKRRHLVLLAASQSFVWIGSWSWQPQQQQRLFHPYSCRRYNKQSRDDTIIRYSHRIPGIIPTTKASTLSAVSTSRLFSKRKSENLDHQDDPKKNSHSTELITDNLPLPVLSWVNGSDQKSAKNGPILLDDAEVARLQKENEQMRQRLRDLEEENEMLRYEVASRIVLETFEGEGKIRKFAQQHPLHPTLLEEDTDQHSLSSPTPSKLTWGAEEIMSEQTNMQWCDELEDGQCPVEPFVSFGEALRDRAYWLVGLLVLQSCSGIILARNEALLANHPVIVYFLTMLVGAGGNAGNQASVRVIRGLALGSLNEQTQTQFLMRELKMAASLSAILSLAGFVRASVFRTPLPETLAVTSALAMIVFSSICLGAILPLILKKVRVDPAHSSTTIQVVMDILGVVLAVVVSSVLLDSPLGTVIISKLGGS